MPDLKETIRQAAIEVSSWPKWQQELLGGKAYEHHISPNGATTGSTDHAAEAWLLAEGHRIPDKIKHPHLYHGMMFDFQMNQKVGKTFALLQLLLKQAKEQDKGRVLVLCPNEEKCKALRERVGQMGAAMGIAVLHDSVFGIYLNWMLVRFETRRPDSVYDFNLEFSSEDEPPNSDKSGDE